MKSPQRLLPFSSPDHDSFRGPWYNETMRRNIYYYYYFLHLNDNTTTAKNKEPGSLVDNWK